jgi:hypothetical protein
MILWIISGLLLVWTLTAILTGMGNCLEIEFTTGDGKHFFFYLNKWFPTILAIILITIGYVS